MGPHHAGAAEVEHPAQQGMVQAFRSMLIPLFVCSATAFMILMTGMYNIQGTLPEGQFLVQNVDAATIISGPAFTQMAVSSILVVLVIPLWRLRYFSSHLPPLWLIIILLKLMWHI